MADDIVYNAKEIVKALNQLEPGLKNAMVREMRKIAKPSISAIKSAIPTTVPSGMTTSHSPNSRLAWGAGVKADSVGFSFKTKASKIFAVTSLASLVVKSPATALADVVGKGSGVPIRNVSRPYSYKGGTRTHRITTQGAGLKKGLRKYRANNFVYPAVEKSLPMLQQELKLILEKYAAKVNRKLN
jgi:hypothetical protein